MFLASNLLFLARAAPLGWLLAAAIACGGATVLFFWRRPPRIVLTPEAGLFALLGLAICLVGGQGGLLFAHEDWLIRNAVLADLARTTGPVAYDIEGAGFVLRAPIGFYMIPAAVGGVLGLRAAHWAMVAQDAMLIACIAWVLVKGLEPAWRRWVVLAVFFAFSGWDLVGETLRWAVMQGGGGASPFHLHMERWSGIEYSSFLTDLFWAPNHGLPALALTAGYLAHKRGECPLPALALLAGLSVIWSPLALMGALPFLVLAALRDLPRSLREASPYLLVLAAGATLLPVAAFVTLATSTVEKGWTVGEPSFRLFYPLFLLIEAAPMLYLVLRRKPQDPLVDRAEMLIVVAMLLALPLYRLGEYNDLVMRASIVPLALGALIAGERLADRIARRDRAGVAAMGLILAVGAVTPLTEIAAAFVYPPQPALALPLPEAWKRTPFGRQDIYMAPTAAFGGKGWVLREP